MSLFSQVDEAATSIASADGVAGSRTWARRVSEMWEEVDNSPLGRAVLFATLAASVARAGGASTRSAMMLGGLGGSLLREVQQTSQRIERQVRNSGDAAVLAGWLGPHTPPLGAWAIEPDFARLVAAEVSRHAPNIVECGSGTSTLLVARTLKTIGQGRLYSIEHDENFAKQTARRLEVAGLSDVVEMVVARLTQQSFGETQVNWYDAQTVLARLPGSFDLLIVDGPPAVQPWARWPAFEVLGDRLALGGTVLMDDGRRTEERRAAYRWQADHPELDLFWLDTVKGTWLLAKRPRAQGTESGVREVFKRLRRTLNPYPTGYGRWPVQR